MDRGSVDARLLLAAWATTSTDLPALRGAMPAAGTNRRVPRSPGNGTVDRSEVEPARVPPWLDAVFIILLVVLAAGLIAILVGVSTRRRRRRRALRLGQGDDPDALDGADEALLTARGTVGGKEPCAASGGRSPQRDRAVLARPGGHRQRYRTLQGPGSDVGGVHR